MLEKNISAEDIMIYNDDCFEILPQLEENSVDLISTYLPGQAKNHHFAFALDLKRLWSELDRILKPDGVVVLEAFANSDMSDSLASSNPDLLRGISSYSIRQKGSRNLVLFSQREINVNSFLGDYLPPVKVDHSGQMPIGVAKDIIRRYADEGETVLDPCMGTGTMGVATKDLGRKFVGIETNPRLFNIAVNRISGVLTE